jgi:hypothetical protein
VKKGRQSGEAGNHPTLFSRFYTGSGGQLSRGVFGIAEFHRGEIRGCNGYGEAGVKVNGHA